MYKNIEIKIIYDEVQIKKAISFYYLHVCNFIRYAIIVYSVLLFSIIMSALNGYNIIVLVFIFVGAYIYNLYYLRTLEGYIKYYNKHKLKTYKFDDEKIYSYGDNYKNECLWSILKETFEIQTAFILVDNNSFIHVIPKSAFEDDLSIQELRKLLSSKFEKFKQYK